MNRANIHTTYNIFNIQQKIRTDFTSSEQLNTRALEQIYQTPHKSNEIASKSSNPVPNRATQCLIEPIWGRIAVFSVYSHDLGF